MTSRCSTKIAQSQHKKMFKASGTDSAPVSVQSRTHMEGSTLNKFRTNIGSQAGPVNENTAHNLYWEAAAVQESGPWTEGTWEDRVGCAASSGHQSNRTGWQEYGECIHSPPDHLTDKQKGHWWFPTRSHWALEDKWFL